MLGVATDRPAGVQAGNSCREGAMPHTESNERGGDRRGIDRRINPSPIDFVDRRQSDRRSGADRRAAKGD